MTRPSKRLIAAIVGVASLGPVLSGCTAFTPPKSVAATPDHERTLLIADTYMKQGHLERAEALYAEVLQQQPASQSAKNGLARIASMTTKQPAVASPEPIKIAAAPVTKPAKTSPKSAPPAIDLPEVPKVEVPVIAATTSKPTTKVAAPAPPVEAEPTFEIPSVTPQAVATADEPVELAVDVDGQRIAEAAAPISEQLSQWSDEFFETDVSTDVDFDLGAAVASAMNTGTVAPATASNDATGWIASQQSLAANEPATIELDSAWRPRGNAPAPSRRDNLARLLTAQQKLEQDSHDITAWRTIDDLLAGHEEATKSLTVLTLGELSESCRPGAVQRLRTVLTLEASEELKASAALALGGLGDAADPAVPALEQIVLTGGEQSRDAAAVTLACLGYAVN